MVDLWPRTRRRWRIPIGLDRGAAHGLRLIRRLWHPLPGRRARHAAVDGRLRVRRGVRPRRLPHPREALHRGRRRRAHPDGRSGRLLPLRAVRARARSAAAGRPAAAPCGTCAPTRLRRTAGPLPTRPACPSSPGWCATTRSPPARSTTRCASPRRDSARLHLPGPARRRLVRPRRAAADGPARPPQGVGRHLAVRAAGAGDPRRRSSATA